MEHLRIDHQISPCIGNGLIQDIFHYVYVRGRCSLVELFPLFARKEGFLENLETLLIQKKLTTNLKSIWAREHQVVFTETPLSVPEESTDKVLNILNNMTHYVGEGFTYEGAININRDFQLQWMKMTLKPGDAFHLGHFDDFRGRLYCKGHLLTYQGTDFQKSLIRCKPYAVVPSNMNAALADETTPTSFTPWGWILADVARSYGMDKSSWEERLQWAYSHRTALNGAKEPFLYKSALKASHSAITDHLVSLDATASGIQCLALMAQDSESAFQVNLGTNVIRNPYQAIKDEMGDYDYKLVKQAVMTSFYESVATPRNLFKDDYPKFVDAARKMLPGPWLMMQAISSCMTEKDFYGWTMMDGYEVNMHVTTPVECSMSIGEGMDMTWIEHRKAPVATKGLTANVTHSLDALVLREVIRRTNTQYEWNNNTFNELREKDILLMQCVLRWKMSQFVSFKLFDYMDEENGSLVTQELRDIIDDRTSQDEMYIQPIHDCYQVKATDATTLFIIVREVMSDLAYAKTAQWILPQLGFKGAINDDESKRTALKQQVLNSTYLIC